MTEKDTRTIRVEYYALLREERGCPEETLTTSARTAEELYLELQGLHGFRLPADRLKVAVNEEFCPWSETLNDGDTVVFVPPVAGG